MEEKLIEAAKKMPQPECTFSEIKQRIQPKKQYGCRYRYKRLVPLALILCLLVTACAYSTSRYGLWGGYSSSSLNDARKAAAEFDYQLPETLNESPFQSFSTAHGAPEGASYLQAMLSPTYKLYSVFYFVEKEEIREDGSSYGWTENAVNISFGTTEKDAWRYHFSVAEDGSKNYKAVEPGSSHETEYRGMTLHLYTIGKVHSVMWEDSQRKMILDLSCYDMEKQEDAVEIAKELIDLNYLETEETLTPDA